MILTLAGSHLQSAIVLALRLAAGYPLTLKIRSTLILSTLS